MDFTPKDSTNCIFKNYIFSLITTFLTVAEKYCFNPWLIKSVEAKGRL